MLEAVGGRRPARQLDGMAVCHRRLATSGMPSISRRATMGSRTCSNTSLQSHRMEPTGVRRWRPVLSASRQKMALGMASAVDAAGEEAELFLGLRCMEDVVEALAVSLHSKAAALEGGRKYVVGIAGPPGGGKSTLATMVSDRINQLASAAVEGGAEVSVVFPMDGFHYYRSELDQMEDPVEAHARRGAHWTFNAQAFLDCLARIVDEGSGYAPSFDHGVGDPVEDDIKVENSHRVLLVEGNYLLLDLEPWRQLRELFDLTLYVDTNVDVAMQRILTRQVGIGLKAEASQARISNNDKPNAELVATTCSRADIVVPSLPFREA